MNKSLLILLAIIIFAGWGCDKKDANFADSSSITLQNETPIEIIAVKETSYSVESIHEESTGRRIDLEYPVFEGSGDEYIKINEEIKKFVDELKESFIEDYNGLDHEYDLGAWFLENSFTVPRNDESFISLVLEGGMYTGGAHPNYFYKTFLFNMEEEGSLMNTADIFNPEAGVLDEDSGAYVDWLNYISGQARLRLMQQDYADADWINEGAGPQAANFALFYLTDKEIVFLFPPYQVAPYAAGPQQVQFTIDELAEYLRAYNF